MTGCAHHTLHGPAGAASLFLLGLTGGLHCLGMCGPLACLFSRADEQPLGRLALYHTGRLGSYATVGAAFAALGAPWRPLLTWPVLAALGVLPLLLWAWSPVDASPPWLEPLYRATSRRLRVWPPGARALALGLLTPLLPCGLLYAAAGAALGAPSPVLGAAWLAAFGAGTLPLLLLGQAGFVWTARLGGGRWTLPLRRATAVLSAATLLYFSFPL